MVFPESFNRRWTMAEEKKEGQESPKSRLYALILCFFFGWAGAHRFYVNKIVTGFIMMFTMGGFGMWWFIDLIMISIGAFKDKDNLPLKKWTFLNYSIFRDKIIKC